MDIVGENLRAQRRPVTRVEPLRAAHEALAWPVYRAYAWLGSAAPAVQLQVLLLSVSAIAGMWGGGYAKLVVGMLLCHAGHVLTLAGRRLAKATPAGSDPWAAILETIVARAVDAGVIAVLAIAAVAGLPGRPSWLPP